jgi:ubiquitin C-terminal hydrolase
MLDVSNLMKHLYSETNQMENFSVQVVCKIADSYELPKIFVDISEDEYDVGGINLLIYIITILIYTFVNHIYIVIVIYIWILRAAQRRGFKNLGQTCFLGSVLMALSHIHELTTFVSKKIDENEFALLYHQSMARLQLTGSDDRVSPELLINALQVHNSNNRTYNHLFLRPDKQQDASEALTAVLQTFEEQSEEYLKFMRSLFAFRLSSTLVCGKCGNSKETKAEYETLLSVEIQEGVDFQTLLNNYFNPETLEGANANECLVCEGNQEGTKQLRPETGPEIAIFMLKRFKTSPKGLRFNSKKIQSFIGL